MCCNLRDMNASLFKRYEHAMIQEVHPYHDPRGAKVL